MSDIYLQITETPTVVTLSAPVVSGALSSTVTVANTVTVALDANSLSALENVTVTVGAAITGTVTVGNFPATQAVSLASVPTHGVTLTSTTVTVSSLPAISGTVTANVANDINVGNISSSLEYYAENFNNSLPVVINNALPSGGNNIGTVAIGSIASGNNRIGFVTVTAGTSQIGSVTISGTVPVSGTFWQATQPVSGTFYQATQPVSLTSTTVTVSSLPALAAGTAQIGSVTASISGTVPISISSVTVGNSVTIGSLPALAAGTAQIGSVTASISNTVVTIYSAQGTTVTNSNFTSTTASTTLVSAVAGRDVLTVFNEGAGNLHISPSATCTTVAYQVRLSAGDYWECPMGQCSLAHTAVFASAGTARVTEVS